METMLRLMLGLKVLRTEGFAEGLMVSNESED